MVQTGDPGGAAWRVRAPARLHFGFLDLNGGLGRRFGSLGVALDRPAMDLAVAAAAGLDVSGPGAARLTAYVQRAAQHLGVAAAGRFHLRATIPPHAGFGSGTQLALAAAAALARLNGRAFDAAAAAAAAAALDRGGRSGIGLGAFLHGGMVVDGGSDTSSRPPPLIARLPFPGAWRLILVLDEAGAGVHGPQESAAFAALPPFPASLAAGLCRLTLMRILPALAEADLAAFGSGIAELQRAMGEHFALAQGAPIASPRVAAALEALRDGGAAGTGQSSWGPTGFALVGSSDAARQLLAALPPHVRHAAGLRYIVARGRNHGASITRLDADHPLFDRHGASVQDRSQGYTAPSYAGPSHDRQAQIGKAQIGQVHSHSSKGGTPA